jgi:hypothetical protein
MVNRKAMKFGKFLLRGVFLVVPEYSVQLETSRVTTQKKLKRLCSKEYDEKVMING